MGVIRDCDGTVEKVFFADLGNEGPLSLVVANRSAGSGGYLSTDASTIGKNTVVLRASVAGLAANADAVVALKSSLLRFETEMTPNLSIEVMKKENNGLEVKQWKRAELSPKTCT